MTQRGSGKRAPTRPLEVVRIYRTPAPWETEAIVLSLLRLLGLPARGATISCSEKVASQ